MANPGRAISGVCQASDTQRLHAAAVHCVGDTFAVFQILSLSLTSPQKEIASLVLLVVLYRASLIIVYAITLSIVNQYSGKWRGSSVMSSHRVRWFGNSWSRSQSCMVGLQLESLMGSSLYCTYYTTTYNSHRSKSFVAISNIFTPE